MKYSKTTNTGRVKTKVGFGISKALRRSFYPSDGCCLTVTYFGSKKKTLILILFCPLPSSVLTTLGHAAKVNKQISKKVQNKVAKAKTKQNKTNFQTPRASKTAIIYPFIFLLKIFPSLLISILFLFFFCFTGRESFQKISFPITERLRFIL